MSKKAKALAKARKNPANLGFADFIRAISAVGFAFDHQTGSHAIYVHLACEAKLTIQPRKDGMAKGYQVHQFIAIVDAFNLEVV